MVVSSGIDLKLLPFLYNNSPPIRFAH